LEIGDFRLNGVASGGLWAVEGMRADVGGDGSGEEAGGVASGAEALADGACADRNERRGDGNHVRTRNPETGNRKGRQGITARSLGCARDDRLGRRTASARTRAPLRVAAKRGRRTRRTGEDGQAGKARKVGGTVPGVEEGQVVFAEKEHEVNRRPQGLAKVLQGEDSIGRLGPADLDVGDAESREVPGR